MATAPQPSLALEDQLCFALYSASRAITARYRPLLEPMGLTYPQYLVMLVLWQSGPTTVGQLGHQLELDSGTLSPLLKRLEAAGLISRHRQPSDERTVEARLTAKGHRLRESALAIPAQICTASSLDPSSIATVVADLHALTGSVRNDLLASN